jgi:hypothetical protein
MQKSTSQNEEKVKGTQDPTKELLLAKTGK